MEFKKNSISKQFKIMCDLFDTPITQKKVRKGVDANQYRNGTININGQKYIGYSMTEAIRMYRKKFKRS